jgi:hypothetical protein
VRLQVCCVFDQPHSPSSAPCCVDPSQSMTAGPPPIASRGARDRLVTLLGSAAAAPAAAAGRAGTEAHRTHCLNQWQLDPVSESISFPVARAALPVARSCRQLTSNHLFCHGLFVEGQSNTLCRCKGGFVTHSYLQLLLLCLPQLLLLQCAASSLVAVARAAVCWQTPAWQCPA